MVRERRSKGPCALILIIGIALILGGCDRSPRTDSKKEEGREKVMLAPKSRKPSPSVPTPAPATSTSPLQQKEEKRHYVYDPTGKRDPFQPFIAMQTPVKPSGEQISLTPLQKYDLSQLKLVAILVGKTEGRAMVEDSEGKGYIVEKGTYIGRNFGKVKKILKDSVIIEERYKDYLGNIRSKEILLRLHVPGEGEKL